MKVWFTTTRNTCHFFYVLKKIPEKLSWRQNFWQQMNHVKLYNLTYWHRTFNVCIHGTPLRGLLQTPSFQIKGFADKDFLSLSLLFVHFLYICNVLVLQIENCLAMKGHSYSSSPFWDSPFYGDSTPIFQEMNCECDLETHKRSNKTLFNRYKTRQNEMQNAFCVVLSD